VRCGNCGTLNLFNANNGNCRLCGHSIEATNPDEHIIADLGLFYSNMKETGMFCG
jgi:hypothetical protein